MSFEISLSWSMEKHLKFIASYLQVNLKAILKLNLNKKSSILARSAAFANIFKAHPREAMIDDVSEATFEEIIKYVYTGEVNVTDNNERKILAAGERFGLKEIISAVHLHRNLRMEPLRARELETLKHKHDEAKYIYHNTKDRYAIKNPFSEPPNVYY